MKSILFVVLLLTLTNAYSIDMSHTESYETSYKINDEGYEVYIGGCSVHQSYENEKFIITKTIIEYFKPMSLSAAKFEKKMKAIDKELINVATAYIQVNSLHEVDDITVERISSIIYKNLDLWRLNIGVGGGNGMYLVFNKILVDGKPSYQLMSDVFDGDVQFCDSAVWILK